jgi:hypothetical protein
MGREDFGPQDGEGYTAFHARLFEKAEALLARRPEQPAKARIDALTFDGAAFGTVPGAGAAAARTAGWTEQTRTQFGRVGAEVADLEVATRTAKELAADVDGATQAVARNVDLGLD